jgi:hypothetical protein
MLLAATEYVRPDSLEDALAALGATAGSRVLNEQVEAVLAAGALLSEASNER